MSGLQIKYAELWSLSLRKLFYQNQVCRDFQTTPVPDLDIVPTDECLQTMNKLDYLFRKTDTNGGCTVWAGIHGVNGAGHSLLKYPAGKADKLTFMVTIKNPELLIFSNLPVSQSQDQIYFFTNDINDAAAPRINLHISKNAAGVDANDRIKRTGNFYKFHSNAPVVPGSAMVKHTLSLIEIKPASLINNNGQADLGFDLSSLPSGKCTLLINNMPVEEFYFLNSGAGKLIFAVIELCLASAVAANYRVVEADNSITSQRPFYSAIFSNRKTTWQYKIHLLTSSPLYLEIMSLSNPDKVLFFANLNIVTNDNTVQFTKISADATDFVFESQQQLLLKEKYFSSSDPKSALRLTLKKFIGLGPPREGEIKNYLPYPSTSQLDATNQNNIYSTIFLTL